MNKRQSLDVSQEKLNEFVINHQYGSIYQTTYYGEAAVHSKQFKDYTYVAVCDSEGNIFASVLATTNNIPYTPFKYAYMHHAFVLDYDSDYKYAVDTLWDAMIKKFKQQNIVYFGFDLQVPSDRTDVYDYFMSKGARHSKQSNDNLHSTWWKYTGILSLEDDLDTIVKNFDKGTRNLIRKSQTFDLEIELGSLDSLEVLQELMEITEKRNDFSNGDFLYPRMHKIFELAHKDDNARIYLLKLVPKKTKRVLENELQKRMAEKNKYLRNAEKKEVQLKEVQSIINKIERQLEELNEIEREHPNGLYLCGAMTIQKKYTVDYLYAGSNNIGRDFYPTYLLLWRIIEDAKNAGARYLSMQGTDPDEESTGLNHFKKRWGTSTVEYSGDFDGLVSRGTGHALRWYLDKHRNYLSFE